MIKLRKKIKKWIFECKNIKSTLNLNDELCKELVRYICYYCSGLSNNNEYLYKICRNLYELKNHCRDRHNGEMEKCIINYACPNEYVQIDPQKNYRYNVFRWYVRNR